MVRHVTVAGILALALAAGTAPAVRAQEETPVAPAAKGSPRPAPSASARPAVDNVGVATRTTIYDEQLRGQNAQNTYDAIKAVPGVAAADGKAGGGADNLQIRGIHLASATGYRMNGWLPFVNNIIMENEDKDQVQVLKGAGAMEYGLTSPAGVVNYNLKRATRAPVTSLSYSTNNFGQQILSGDIGRRFGPGDQFGVRVNVAGGDTGNFVVGAGGARYIRSVAADWRTKPFTMQFDVESFGIDLIEQTSLLQTKVAANGQIPLPNFPDPSLLMSGPWARSTANGENYGLKTTYRLGGGVSFQAEAGHSIADRLRRAVSQFGNYNVVTGKGTETVNLIQDQIFENTYKDFSFKFTSGSPRYLGNELNLGYSDSARLFNNPQNPSVSYTQNLYSPVFLPAPVYPTTISYQPQNSGDRDFYFHDSMIVAGRLHLIGGLRKINYWANDVVNTGTTAKPVLSTSNNYITSWAPGYAAVVDAGGGISAYGSWVKALEETGLAPINAKNAFQALPPAPATQEEFGLRFAGRSTSANLAYFDITRANATTDPVSQIYALNGTNRFSGVEAKLIAGEGRKFTFLTSGQIMKAVQNSTDPTINGLRPENTPILSGSVGFNYRMPIDGLTINGEMLMVGPRMVNPQDQGTIQASTIFNTGFTYALKNRGVRYNFIVTCKNCGDKKYWSSAVNNALGLGTPRTVTLTVRTTPTAP